MASSSNMITNHITTSFQIEKRYVNQTGLMGGSTRSRYYSLVQSSAIAITLKNPKFYVLATVIDSISSSNLDQYYYAVLHVLPSLRSYNPNPSPPFKPPCPAIAVVGASMPFPSHPANLRLLNLTALPSKRRPGKDR